MSAKRRNDLRLEVTGDRTGTRAQPRQHPDAGARSGRRVNGHPEPLRDRAHDILHRHHRGRGSSAALAEKERADPRAVRGRILRNLGAFVLGFTVLYMASGATVALMGQQLMQLQTQFTKTGRLGDPFCGPSKWGSQKQRPMTHTASGAHANHGPGFGEWARYANWLGSAFLVFFALNRSACSGPADDALFGWHTGVASSAPALPRSWGCFAETCEYHSRTGREHASGRQYHSAEFFLCGVGTQRELSHLHGRRHSLSAAYFRRHLYVVLGRADSRHLFARARGADGRNRSSGGKLCLAVRSSAGADPLAAMDERHGDDPGRGVDRI